jgi:hypothetical protein
MPEDDRDLRDLFAELRRREQQAAPSFPRVWAAAQARREPRPRLRFALAAAAIVALLLGWPRSKPVRAPDAPSAVARWRSPTAFLLATPGRELLSTIPALGAPALPGLSALEPSPPPSRTPKGETS